MATGLSGKASGTIQTIVDPQGHAAGAWHPIQEAYGKVGGVWQTTYLRNFIFTTTISADTNNYNVSTAAVSAGWNGVDPLVATITINGGVVVGSTTLGAAFTVPSLPSGSTVAITNNGYIVGRGGTGGNGVNAPANGTAGSPGGLALSVAYATTITNNTTIGGGGGGGGGGDAAEGTSGGGGGGSGRATAAGGTSPGNAGSPGTYNAGGGGGAHIGADAGDGGPGGNLGQDGFPGADRPGGAAGACTSGNSFITWAATGTRSGALG